jgi:thiol-disulfide isomerase/thioredoxin
MKLLILLFIFTSTIGFAQIQNYNIGDIVDDFTVTDIHGEMHNLYTYTNEGKYVYIDFSFTTCGPCRSLAPIYNQFYDKYGCNTGDLICLSVFGINNDSDSDVEDFENTYGGSYNHAPAISNDGGGSPVDGNFNPYQYPTVCLINPNNEIIELDIWPINNISQLEATFPDGFNPEVITCSVAGSNEIEETSLFSFYPNPFNGKELHIDLHDKNNTLITIYSILGKILYRNTIDNTTQTINTNLTTGYYLLTAQTNSKIASHKLIVE